MSNRKTDLLYALILRLEGEVAIHRSNINVYLDNPVGIGEHPDIVAAIESEAEKMATAQEKIDILENQFNLTE